MCLGAAPLGFAQYLPNENMLMTVEQLNDMMAMALGGRAAEQVMLGRISTGAQNDLERVTKLAYSQVAIYGMNPVVGLLSFPPEEGQLNKPYSDDTARIIDTEVRSLVDYAYKRTLKLLEEKRDLVEGMAQALLKKEVLGTEDLEALLGARPYRSNELRNIDKFRGGFKSDDGGSGNAPDVEDAEVTPKAPLPPTDTPAGDLALAAKQLSQEDAAAAGMQPSEAPAVAATAADKQGGEAEAEAGDGERQHKKRPRIVAT